MGLVGDEGLRLYSWGWPVPGGVDIMVHTVQVAMERHPEWACGTVDIKNAFNSVSRGVMAQRVIELFPEVWPYFATCYGDVSQLLFGVRDADGIVRRRFVESADGSHQGDPRLGCLLFGLVLHPVLEECLRVHPRLEAIDAYCDDIHLLGPRAPQTLWRLLSSGCVSASQHLLGR